MKKLYSLFLLLGLLLLVNCSKDEVKLSGIISGLVSDYTNSNQPIAGVSITLNTKGITKTTGNDGRFEFVDLEPGTYTLQAKANNYQTTTKQVTVYAGETVTCDFQLEKAMQGKSISIEPENIIIAATVDQSSFTIKSNLNESLDYTISDIPDYLNVSPAMGKISAKGQRAISVSVINRQAITTQHTAHLIVNVGNDSYTVNVTIEPYKTEQINIEITPVNLVFEANVDQISFTIKNKNTFSHDYQIANKLSSSLTVSPISGTVAANSSCQVNVSVKNHQQITSDVSGIIGVSIGNVGYVINVTIKKYGGGQDSPSGDATRGLQAYYTFDKGSVEDSKGDYDGFLSGGSFITGTVNGSGKALSLSRGSYMTIGTNPLSGRKSWTVSMWVKDFGQGVFIRSTSGNYYDLSPTWNIDGNGKITYNTYDRRYSTFGASLSSYSGEWTMLTIVSDGTIDKHTLYVNGVSAYSFSSDGTLASSNTTLQIGGQTWYEAGQYVGYDNVIWTDAMKVDNIRLYSVALTADEVKSIYNKEK